MALQTKVSSITAPAAAGNQSYSGVGFQPKVLIFWATDQTATGFAAHQRMMFGAGTGSALADQRVACSQVEDNVNPSSASRRTDDAVLNLIDSANALRILARIVTLDSDGFTLDWVNTVSGLIVNYLAIGGTDLTNVKVAGWTNATVTGNQDITGVGFQPECVILFGMGSTSLGSANSQNRGTLGAAISSAARWAMCKTTESVASMTGSVNAEKRQLTTACMLVQADNGAVAGQADFVSFLSDGFRINWSTALTSALLWGYIAFRGGQYHVGAFNQASGTPPYTQDVTSPGFQPTGVLFGSFCAAAATVSVIDAEVMVGAASGAGVEGVVWTEVDDAVLPIDANDATLQTKVLKTANSTSTTLDEADLDSFLSNGYRLNWSSASTTVLEEFCHVVFGNAAAAADNLPFRRRTIAIPKIEKRTIYAH